MTDQQLAAGIALTAGVAGCWAEAGVNDYGEIQVLRRLFARRLDALGAVSIRELSHQVDPLWSRGRTGRVVDRLLARGLIVDGQRAKKNHHALSVADSVEEEYRHGIGPAIWRLAIDYRTSRGVAETLAPALLPDDPASIKRVLQFELDVEDRWLTNVLGLTEYSVGLTREGRTATRERHLRILKSGSALAVSAMLVTLDLRGRPPVSERKLIGLCGIKGSVHRVVEELSKAELVLDERREQVGHRHRYLASEQLTTAADRHLDVLDELVNNFIEIIKTWK